MGATCTMAAPHQLEGRLHELLSFRFCRIESKKEDDMENLVGLGQAALGLGVFFMGIAALWFVSVYQEKKD